ncbi:MAG: HAD-superfamily hydrolase, subfamily variant 3, partial [Candidatus Saccharibacteria bacterium]|nr:HAD-superfamily hydrolase, subfamily variant 3 [Candidatus Saccharibacteria bacterium]
MIRALIFDCFGVLYSDGKGHIENLCPLDKQEELRSLYRQSDYGFIGREEFIAQVTKLINISREDLMSIEREEYVRNKPLVDFIRAKKPHYKTGLLSNVGEAFLESLFTEQEIKELFDEIILSSKVGMMKPSQEIYDLAASRLGFLPEECVFIDDRLPNVDGAQMAGMKGLLFTSNHQLEIELT